MNHNHPAYWVYVVELDSEALAEKDQPEPGKTALYVGYTSQTPEIRLGKHQLGVRPAAAVFRRMADPSRSKLRPDLARYPGPYATEREARRFEKTTHNRLKSEGYVVFGDKGKKLKLARTSLQRRS